MDATVAAGSNEVEDGGSANIKIKVSYGSNNFDVYTSSQSTFADLKKEIAKTTGLDPKMQNLLFRGKEKDDNEHLHMAGVKDNAKVILLDSSVNSPTKNQDLEKVEEVKENSKDIAKVEEVKENVEDISRGLEAVRLVREENNEFAEQLLKLDGIDAEGEGRMQRKLEVRRVQGLVDKLDNLKEKNANPSIDIPKMDSIEPSTPSSSKVTQE